jgi:hypothetical protein
VSPVQQDYQQPTSVGCFSRTWRCRHTIVLAALLIFAANSHSGEPGQARYGSTGAGDSSWIEPHVVLDPVTSLDYQGLGRWPSLPRQGVRSASLRGFHHLEVSAGSTSIPEIDAVVYRTIPSLWRIALPAGESVHDLDVRYELVSSTGKPNRLGHDQSPHDEITARVRPLPPSVSMTSRGHSVAEGSVELEFDLTRAPQTGTYRGTLYVTVTHS